MAAAAGLVALLLAMAGCGTDGATAPGPSTTPTQSAAGAVVSADALLTAEQMPAWNGAMGWVEQELPAGVGALSVCALPTAESLGAVTVLTRDFEAAGVEDPGTTPDPTWPPSYGTNQVAQFADVDAATAAVQAWEAAVGQCVSTTSAASEPTSFQITDTTTGSTWTAYVADPSTACPECLRFEFLGFTVKGTAVSTVGFSLTGQDANYEGDPLAESMDDALARLP